MASVDVKTQIDEYIKKAVVVVFSKSWCPFCHRVKGLFQNLNIEFLAIELDQLGGGMEGAFQDALAKMTGARSVPRVFINGESVGGCDDTFSLHAQGKLKVLVDSAL